MKNRTNSQSGYIALVTVIILMAILFIIGASLGISTYFNRADLVAYELKERSYFLAYSCIDIGHYKAWDNLDYTGNEIINIDSETCVIDPITTIGTNTFIEARASSSKNFSHLKMSLDAELTTNGFSEIK